MVHALDREVDDGIVDWLESRAVGHDVTGAVQCEKLQVHLVHEGQVGLSGEFVVGYHLVFPDNIEAEFLSKNENKKAKLK